MSVLREQIWYGYRIVGNQYVAIAVDLINPINSHYFSIDPDCNNDAFIRACSWAFENHDTIGDELNTPERFI